MELYWLIIFYIFENNTVRNLSDSYYKKFYHFTFLKCLFFIRVCLKTARFKMRVTPCGDVFQMKAEWWTAPNEFGANIRNSKTCRLDQWVFRHALDRKKAWIILIQALSLFSLHWLGRCNFQTANTWKNQEQEQDSERSNWLMKNQHT